MNDCPTCPRRVGNDDAVPGPCCDDPAVIAEEAAADLAATTGVSREEAAEAIESVSTVDAPTPERSWLVPNRADRRRWHRTLRAARRRAARGRRS